MEQRDTIGKCLLRLGAARHREMHRAQLLLSEFLLMMIVVSEGRAAERRSDAENPGHLANQGYLAHKQGTPRLKFIGSVEAGSTTTGMVIGLLIGQSLSAGRAQSGETLLQPE